ncbi:methionyl-tRNA formyltransferase [Candidatus Peregrinibacteria bacterium]|nr:methionyl-tRNA formyltransferase [Candidatus Peregrinibacteria bacterium]
MKTVFFGTPDFAVPFLKTLHGDKDIEILAVVCQPDKKIGRKQILTQSPVKTEAAKLNLTVLQPQKLKNNPDFFNLIKALKADFFVVVAYGKIIPTEYLDIPKYGAVNVHGSLLPRYRGASPIQTALLNGDKETGISFMKISKELDTGDVYLLKREAINKEDNFTTLSAKLAKTGAVMLPSVLKDIQNHVLEPIPQNDSKATYCKKISKKDSLLDAQNESSENILNKLRAYTPWPGIYINFNNKKIKIINAEITNDKVDVNPGNLKAVNKNLYLGTKNGALIIYTIQPEGKKVLAAQDFINGFLR